MVLTKEYRMCMPFTRQEYRVGQLYMIARHSHEQSDNEEGVEIVSDGDCDHPDYGKGHFTEKKIYLFSKLPKWIQSFLPKIFYITERAWNYYPFTITEYTCSFYTKFNISIRTRYEDNNGTTENSLGLTPIQLKDREVDFVDIAYDEISPKDYKEEEDPKYFQSKRTGRGPLVEGWKDTTQPIMCSYKLVHVSVGLWGMHARLESFIHKSIRDILLLGHRQAFAWIDDWYDMTLDDVREYERKMQSETNSKRLTNDNGDIPSAPTTPTSSVPFWPLSNRPTEV